MGQFELISFMMKSIFLVCLLVTLSFQFPAEDPGDEYEEEDFDFRDKCASHCTEADYDDTSEYHETGAEWCYEMYFYDDDTKMGYDPEADHFRNNTDSGSGSGQ